MAHDEDPISFEEMAHAQSIDERIDQHLRADTSMPSDLPKTLEQPFLQELHDFYQPQAEAIHHTLDHVWDQLKQRSGASAQPRQHQWGPIERFDFQQERLHSMHPISRTGMRWSTRIASLVAVALLVVLIGGLTLGLVLVRNRGNSPGPTGTSPNQTQAAATSTPFTVTSVDLTVTPASIAGKTCGSSVTFTYTATFHIPAGTAGGTIQYEYTVNNGRSSTSASVNVSPGQTTQTATFTSSGTLPPDHTYPELAEVLVTSPGSVHSPQVQPGGSCVAAAAFQVTSIDMKVSPTSIAGHACGTQITVTYTATFHIAPNGPGGTIHFTYTVNNGRGDTLGSVSVAAGQTVATYSFTWKGALPADHTAPEGGGVDVTSPNQITSTLVSPTGRCS